ncbi:MAG: zinc-dependent metalloprotease [Bacteroidia bacterium]|nr:zinc-dependent metalloprotease [Bacteroidia bacterium]MCF8428216.1 zinc-dependent metalloprotease [Bacteroidia bacterium]MCF8448145.1 zinc-dependent metalloprotease [Bacteroidia bacterium]
MKRIIFLLFSSLALVSSAQQNHCATEFSAAQWQQLRAIQQQIDTNPEFMKKKAMQYVPVKFHIIGNSKGVGYYSIHQLLETICELNQKYTPVGFHFYIADSVSYINDNDLYNGSADAIWNYASDFKLNGAVNVFFHGAGMQWCGVYFGGVDVVFIKNSCQGPNATTLTHELGHFFGLPHTFSGWEGGDAPPSSDIEKIDGSNCRTAGDGFCDTKADYVSQRWSCPLPWNLTDPNNVVFKPDSSIYMSYSSDNCQSRFSTEQMQAMNSNLNSRGWAKPSADLRSLIAPQKQFPTPGDTGINALHVPLKWNAVEGAFAYHVQVARFGDWNYLNYDELVYNTATTIKLFGNWEYAWRVRAITQANTCSNFGVVDTFTTRELPLGQTELFFQNEVQIYPNPVRAGEQVLVRTKEPSQLTIFNELGQTEMEFSNPINGEFSFEMPCPGLYFIALKTAHTSMVKRLLVTQN